VDCDDPDCAGDPLCPGAACAATETIGCGSHVAGTTALPSLVTGYGCDNLAEGGEAIYRLSLALPRTVSISVLPDDPGDELSLSLLVDEGLGCSPEACLAYAETSSVEESLVLEGSGGATYYLAVDGVTPDDFGGFLLAVDCGELTVEHCANGIDDDGDGAKDCLDTQCESSAACLSAEICDDATDNDGDGAVDCADLDCVDEPICGFELCSNGIDDDGDGAIDCIDTDCNYSPNCGGPGYENCDDGQDNDGDGWIDCADGNCSTSPDCVAEGCTDGLDNDGDGQVDCADPDCFPEAVCITGSCSATETLVCGGSISGLLSGSGSIGAYACDLYEAGPEATFQLSPDVEGTVSLSLDYDPGIDLDLIVSGPGSNCQIDTCTTSVASFELPETLSFYGYPTETYHVFVDGPSVYDVGSFTLAVDCGPATVEICGNGVDDDGDLEVDCDDLNCIDECRPPESCNNGIDDDIDQATDCGDPDCAAEPNCQ
jgi:hypothetical protein